ncbi:GyrI-like domain-containing protein [Nemorincola caseinilytica]|uniref:GyrI-like domain-containing protein n=1 Tax=Nemorincola caseinilytica TaxID=2054315 RepID=A0ABP8NCZ3_9BACT
MKQDLTKTYKAYYTAPKEPAIAMMDTAHYISIAGQGDPSGPGFAASVTALYSTAYTIKFMCKEMGSDFTVPKLEGQWWYDEELYKGLGITDAPTKIPREEWSYRLLIRMPEQVTGEMIATAKDTALRKKGVELVKDVLPFTIEATKVVHMMHIGPFSTEPVSLQKMMALIEKEGLQRNGLHHEIYLSDMRKTEPAKLRTILREPMK